MHLSVFFCAPRAQRARHHQAADAHAHAPADPPAAHAPFIPACRKVDWRKVWGIIKPLLHMPTLASVFAVVVGVVTPLRNLFFPQTVRSVVWGGVRFNAGGMA